MTNRRIASHALHSFFLLLIVAGLNVAFVVPSQADEKPILRANLNGPVNTISALAFSIDGNRLYASSWDKRVHVWVKRNGRFDYEPGLSFRVPVHGGLDGAITAISLSSDGKWIAVGGRGARLDTSGVRDEGYIWPGDALTNAQRLAEGVIYVFNTQTRRAIVLKGHSGTVSALSFAPGISNGIPALVSLAEVESDGDFEPEIRLWDVQNEKTVAVSRRVKDFRSANSDLQALRTVVPQLLVKQIGSSGVRPEVGICFPFQKGLGFLVWDTSTDRWSQLDPNGGFLALSATLSTSNDWLIAAVNERNGQGTLGAIQPSGRKGDLTALKLTPQRTLPSRLLPYQVAAISGDGGTNVVLAGEYGTATPGYSIVIDQLRSRTPQQIPLWSGHPQNPILAVAPDGMTAVVDKSGVAIRIANANQNSPTGRISQTLDADLIDIKQATFVTSGNDAGLLVRPTDGPAFVFNIAQGITSKDVLGWSSNSIVPPYKATALDPATALLTIERSGRRATLPLCRFSEKPARLIATATTSTLIAVAWLEGAEPRFDVYDIASGELRRRLRGLEAPVTSLDISQDRRLLAAATSSGIVHLFRLGDSVESEHGLIRNQNQILSLRQAANQIRVSEKFLDLSPGDVITGIELDGQRVELASAVEFYELIHGFPPGMELNLISTRKTITVRIGHAIEEKKPLFSVLFSHSGPPQNDIAWVGWHPIGVFESGDRRAESLLGWHFNTGNEFSPTSFAEIEEYRDRFYRQGLLESLYRTGQIPARAAIAPAQLSLQLRTEDDAPIVPEQAGEYFLQAPRVKAVLRVHDPFPNEAIGEVKCELLLGDRIKPFDRMEQTGIREWTFEFDEEDWSATQGIVRASVVSSEYSPRVFRESVSIRYQPSAPTLTVLPIPQETKDSRQTISVDVQSSEWARTRLSVVRVDSEGNRQTILNQIVENGLQTIDAELQEGQNRIEIVASNGEPLPEYESFETTSAVQTIRYVKPISTAPPEILLTELETLGTRFDLTRVAGELVVYSQSVTILGSVTSQADLKSLTILHGTDEINPPTVRDEASKSVSFQQKVDLQPGSNEIVVKGVTISDVEAKYPLKVFFRPIPAKPVIETVSGIQLPGGVPLATGETVPSIGFGNDRLVLNSQQFGQQIELTFRRQGPGTGTPESEQFEFLIDGQAVTPSQLSESDSQMTALIPIEPGEQRLKIISKNEWGGKQESEAVTIAFHRPPSIVGVEVVELPDQPFLRTLMLQIQSPDDLPVRNSGILASVNGRPLRSVLVDLAKTEPGRWLATIQEIPLTPDSDNQLRLSVRNEDGETYAPWEQIVTTPPERIPPPQIVLITPETESQTQNAELEIKFRVESKLEIQSVSVTNDDFPTEATTEFDDVTGHYVTRLKLYENINSLTLNAIDQDGQPSEPVHLTVNRIPPPSRIQLDSIGELAFDSLQDAVGDGVEVSAFTSTVAGHVELDAPPAGPLLVRVWLNDFLQQTVMLKHSPSHHTRWDFSSMITMNRDVNVMRLELIGGPADSSSTREVKILCDNPITEQILHLVLLSPEESDQEGAAKQNLLEKTRESLTISCDEGECSSPAFAAVREHSLIGRTLQVGRLNYLFSVISAEINQQQGQARRNQSAMNHVILVFYSGREYRFADGRFVLATGGRRDLLASQDDQQIQSQVDSLITSELLVDWMGQLQGAHLLFLDVESNRDLASSHDVTDPHLGVYRKTRGTLASEETSPLLKALSQITPRTRYLGEVSDELTPIASSSYTPSGLQRMEFGAAGE